MFEFSYRTTQNNPCHDIPKSKWLTMKMNNKKSYESSSCSNIHKPGWFSKDFSGSIEYTIQRTWARWWWPWQKLEIFDLVCEFLQLVHSFDNDMQNHSEMETLSYLRYSQVRFSDGWDLSLRTGNILALKAAGLEMVWVTKVNGIIQFQWK